MSPETEALSEGDLSMDSSAERAARSSVSVALDRFAHAYSTQNRRMLGSVLHQKFRFFSSEANPELPEVMMRREVLTSTNTMFSADDVISVSVSLEHGEPRPLSWRRRLVEVDATVTMEVTMQNTFGPPVVYLVDHHPARFVLHRRGWSPRSPWAIVEQHDLFAPEGGERVELPRTFGQVLDMFLQR
jgi:hypothetical protein